MKSLKQRLTLGLLAGLAGLLVLGGSILYPAVRRVLVSEFDHAQAAKLRALTALPEAGREGINLFFVEGLLSEFQPGMEPEYFQVWLQDGSVMGRSASLGTNELPRRLGTEQKPMFTSVTLPDGRPGRMVGIAFGAEAEGTEDSVPVGEYTVGVALARDTVRLHRVLSGLLAGIGLTGLVLMGLAIWVVHLATRAGLRPVEALARELGKIDVGSLQSDLRVEKYPAELRPIVEQINLLVMRIAAGLERERRFASNAAHELLTPVAELRAMAEAAQQWSGDPEATRELAADTLDTAKQMEHLLRNLLFLAGAEANLAALRMERMDLAELLGELRGYFEERMEQKRLQVEWKVGGEIWVRSDRVLCKSILFNLLDNAVEYAPGDGLIRLSAAVEKGRAEVRLANSVEGFSEGDLEHFFEPLWRKDSARTARGHAGLGLAVARTFATALEAELSGKLIVGDLLEFTLLFPQSAPGVFAESAAREELSAPERA